MYCGHRKGLQGIPPLINPGADPRIFVGVAELKKWLAIWPLWPPYGPQFSPSTGHIGTINFGPHFVFMHPFLGPKLLFTTKIGYSFIKYLCFGPPPKKMGSFPVGAEANAPWPPPLDLPLIQTTAL